MAGAVVAVHGLWIALLFGRGYEARDFIGLGTHFITKAPQGHGISLDPHYHYVSNGIGYDGQFDYYIAVDPGGAAGHIDAATYRYGRILYPLLSRAVALGRAGLVPLALILVNVAAAGAGTLALAAWLRREGWSPWPAAVFGLSPGIVVGVHRDLTEPLAYALCAVALYILGRRPWWGWLGGSAVFGLAVLTREATAVFPLTLALYALAQALTSPTHRRAAIARAVAVGGLGVVPFLAWELYLQHWIGPLSTWSAAFTVVPLQGLWQTRPWHAGQYRTIATVVLPALLAGALALLSLARGVRRPEPYLLLVNVAVFVVALPGATYFDTVGPARVASGVVLAGVMTLPAVGATTWGRALGAVTATLWLAILPLILVLNVVEPASGLIRA